MRTQTYTHRSIIPAPASEVFQYHLRDGALQRLTPPWEKVQLLEQSGDIQHDRKVTMRVKIGPIWRTWVAQHQNYEPGRSFTDIQLAGPFAHWKHVHRVNPVSDTQCELIDAVEYALPAGALGELLAGSMTHKQLQRMFIYRHRITTEDVIRTHLYHSETSRDQALRSHVLVTGSTGLIGTSLIPLLTTAGHHVSRLQRSTTAHTPATLDGTQWISLDNLATDKAPADLDAVVHLAGETIMGRWTPEKKSRIRASRVDLTRKLCESLAKLQHKPKVLVAASAIGIYGDQGDREITESSTHGDDFLAQVGRDWEAACQPAVQAGIRVVNLRIGVVLTPRGAALAGMLTPFQMGIGGPISHGRQYWSWITLDDLLYLIHHVIHDDSLQGPINAVAPLPLTNRDFTKTLGRVLRRPTILPVPAFALKLLMGDVADFATASQRVVPRYLLDHGYSFAHPDLESALRHLLGRHVSTT